MYNNVLKIGREDRKNDFHRAKVFKISQSYIN